MRAKYTEAQRRELIRAWRRSKKGVAEFCKARGIVEGTFYAWLRSRGGRDLPTVGLVEAVPVVDVEPAASSAWAWELVGAKGTLRGQALDSASLEVLASAVLGNGR